MKIGVDFDGTLAQYDKWRGAGNVGEPILPMVERVKSWLAVGYEVVIFTARAHPSNGDEVEASKAAIRKWCLDQFGTELEITSQKDPHMDELWDDRAVRVEFNMGVVDNEYVEGKSGKREAFSW